MYFYSIENTVESVLKMKIFSLNFLLLNKFSKFFLFLYKILIEVFESFWPETEAQIKIFNNKSSKQISFELT
jgi:hypothetical protein